jgi:N-acetylneuraminate lyase
MSRLLNFKGLMAPVFTGFNSKNQVNLDRIEPFAKLLKSKEVNAVLVNGTSGEAMQMSRDERMRVAEKWSEVCKKEDMIMMVQVGGCSFIDAMEHTKHAASLGVDGILSLPELYFKPKSTKKAVEYLNEISSNCSNIPLFYYHIPVFSQVDLPMAELTAIAKKEISNFAGIKYSSGDLEKALPCLNNGQVFIGSNTILCGALALGFNSAIMTSLNVFPEPAVKMMKYFNSGEFKKAQEQQFILNDFIQSSMKKYGDWLPSMKKTFNEKFNDISMGEVRKPL